ncbi:hypothetical protein BKA67DRAFT_61769 [Truncatella angustata]|uniref:Uncharacterized protein n=1 Tax=Truncatella angustata TaxID=152316 RepID=A0A9P8UYG1_9PEZI|nr:uncharacterized protein BKA67DRAFT_61769 [Truncatella angustata]KAH6660673.1 hypothetical protein BKA67DRAFT_61769 [Truncatella angustata]
MCFSPTAPILSLCIRSSCQTVPPCCGTSVQRQLKARLGYTTLTVAAFTQNVVLRSAVLTQAAALWGGEFQERRILAFITITSASWPCLSIKPLESLGPGGHLHITGRYGL